MNMKDYMTNPMGKGSSVLMLNEIRRTLDNQYDTIKDKIKLQWYILKHNKYIAHLKIPSKTHDKLYYDVILEFDADTILGGLNTINSANMKVFSNCPSFTYTYAYVFYQNSWLCDWTKSKYQKEIFRKKPESRNPNKIVSYERSLYFAIKYLTTNGRNYKSKIDIITRSIDSYTPILQTVVSNQDIENRYHTLTQKKRMDYLKKHPEKKSGVTGNKSKSNTVHAKGGLKKTSTVKSTTKTKRSKHTKKF